MSLGDFDAGTVIDFLFTTFQPSTGAPFTLAGSPAISVYENNSATQSTAGVTLMADFDGVTGLNLVVIDTSADGTFYAAGRFFSVVITTGTVNSVSAVGVVAERFTLRADSSLKPATAGRTLVVDGSGLGDANAVKVGPTGAGTAQTARDLGNALPTAAPNTALGLLISVAGGLDMDDIGADVDAIETRVALALPNAAPQAAGGLITSLAGSQNIDEAIADIDEIVAFGPPPSAASNASTLLAAALTVHDTTAITTSTVNDALLGARSQGGGAWGIVGTTLTLQNPDGSTFRTFTLDSSTAPTSRT